MKLNSRDGASIAATTVLMQPVIVLASAFESLAFSIDASAQAADPTMGMAFVGTWLVQTLAVVVLKTLACLMRNYGGSFFRDFVVWCWRWWLSAIWESIKGMFWKPKRRPGGGGRKPSPAPSPGPPRRRPIRDFLQRRRPRSRDR